MNETLDVSVQYYYVYVLFSLKDKGWYIGYTRDIARRFSQHQKGEVLSTAHRRPFKIIHYEGFINKKDAESREVYLKSGYGRENLKKSMKNTLAELE